MFVYLWDLLMISLKTLKLVTQQLLKVNQSQNVRNRHQSPLPHHLRAEAVVEAEAGNVVAVVAVVAEVALDTHLLVVARDQGLEVDQETVSIEIDHDQGNARAVTSALDPATDIPEEDHAQETEAADGTEAAARPLHTLLD